MEKVKCEGYIIVGVLTILILILIYNITINNQVSIITEEIKIENLPKEFQGFTILQLTDLHSKSFGENQEELLKVINSLNYDLIAITGDMQNDTNSEPFITLLEGIENKEEVFYTSGNHGPYVYEGDNGFQNFLKSQIAKSYKVDNKSNVEEINQLKEQTEVGKKLEELGVNYLEQAYEIKRGDESIWISELLYQEQLNEITNNKYNEESVKIAITHYPMSQWIYEGEYGDRMPKYDLVLAGHYHGGQWRIPGFGAFLIPDLNESGWFPSQDRVSGLTEWGGIKQYVSRGLGAGSNIKWLRFRLFNKPEINLIKLVIG